MRDCARPERWRRSPATWAWTCGPSRQGASGDLNGDRHDDLIAPVAARTGSAEAGAIVVDVRRAGRPRRHRHLHRREHPGRARDRRVRRPLRRSDRGRRRRRRRPRRPRRDRERRGPVRGRRHPAPRRPAWSGHRRRAAVRPGHPRRPRGAEPRIRARPLRLRHPACSTWRRPCRPRRRSAVLPARCSTGSAGSGRPASGGTAASARTGSCAAGPVA